MKTLDWIVLISFLTIAVLHGILKGRGTRTIRSYMLADKTMPWYAVALSIMATQASAITFVSTTGQAYADGMRFVQVYFGLPIAMVVLAIVAVPIFHRLSVYTAYEYLERRFDLKTRALTGIIFLIQRGLSASISLYAPALILSVILGWDMTLTLRIIGILVIAYTTLGGVKAVNWNDFYMFLIIMGGMIVALIMTLTLLPADISFGEAVSVAGAFGRLNLVDLSFDLENRYNFWSGLLGGLFLALAYFGTDQSQVQRYLTGRSITQSRLGLLFNGLAKVPMQFFILFVGAMVFVFYQFITPPLFFNPVEEQRVRSSPYGVEYRQAEMRHQKAESAKRAEIRNWLKVSEKGNDVEISEARKRLRLAQQESQLVKTQAVEVLKKHDPEINTNDVNYVFLTFVTQYLPAGLVGLIIVVVFAATMSSSSSEMNALATTSVIDIYKRLFRQEGSERHYLMVSRIATLAWGIFAVSVSERASRLGTLVEAVNILGSLFYGTVLGIFMLAFFFKHVKGTAAFIAALGGEALVIAMFKFTNISFLWYNVFGSLAVVVLGLILHPVLSITKSREVKNSHE